MSPSSLDLGNLTINVRVSKHVLFTFNFLLSAIKYVAQMEGFYEKVRTEQLLHSQNFQEKRTLYTAQSTIQAFPALQFRHPIPPFKYHSRLIKGNFKLRNLK